MAEAAGVTFYALLALFPAIAALISLYGLVADRPRSVPTSPWAAGVIPEGGMQIITDQVKSLTSSGNKALGLGAIVGIFVSLWSASAGVRSLFDALNAVYEEKEARGFVHRVLLSLAFTLGGILFVVLAVTGVVVLPIALDYAGLKSSTDLLIKLARWPVLLAAITFVLAMIYRFGPSRGTGEMALGKLGQRLRRPLLGAGLGGILLLRRQFWQLQQDLWLPGCRNRLHDLDLDIHHHHC